MATLTAYKGLQVVSPDPTGDGGLAIQDDFKALVDWSPKSSWSENADPTANDDQTDDYYPGSLWLRTDTTPPKLFVCQSSGTGSAIWRQVLLEVVQDASPQLGGDLDVNGYEITTSSNGNVVIQPDGTGKVGIGSAAPSSALTVGGAIATPITAKSSNYTLTEADSAVVGNSIGSSIILTLPTAVGIAGRQYLIKRGYTSSFNVTVAAASGETIDGNSSIALNGSSPSAILISDGSDWHRF